MLLFHKWQKASWLHSFSIGCIRFCIGAMAENSAPNPSSNGLNYTYYYWILEEAPKSRYKEKLAMVGGMQDPYLTINTTARSA